MAAEAEIKPIKLIVAMAFVRDEEGELRPAFDPREMRSEERATREARLWAGTGQYEGTLAWWRSANLTNGVFGELEVLFQWARSPTWNDCARSGHPECPAIKRGWAHLDAVATAIVGYDHGDSQRRWPYHAAAHL